MTTKEKALVAIRTEYRRLDRMTGVNTESIQLAISSRLSKKLGYFQARKKGAGGNTELKIVISEMVLKDNAVFLDVIRHEYAHAMVYLRYPGEKHLHDKVWKGACLEIGCIPKASRSLPNAFETQKCQDRPYKYIVRCSNCGAESKYKTESKIVKIACGKLKGSIFCRCCRGNQFSVKKIK